MLSKMVDQPEYGKNTGYLVDFIKKTFSAKLLNLEEIRNLYVNQSLSAVQIARHFGVAKSVIIVRLHSLGIREGVNSARSTNPQNYRCRIPPYGFSIRAGKLVPNKAELRVCRAIVELIDRQGKSAICLSG